MIQILFKRNTNFTGRNGYMKCSGVEILPLAHGHSVMISPITSKGTVGKCDIEIPAEHLLELASELQGIHERLKK